jgi:hypothetical protein
VKELELQLKKINRTYKKEIALPLSINYGDEIAGLFESPKNIYDIVSDIRRTLYPQTTIRYAVVRGKVAVSSTDIRKVGGTVFKEANQAIKQLKEIGGYSYWQFGNKSKDLSLVALTETTNLLLTEMTEYQREVYEMLSKGHSQTDIAKKLNKYVQSVWDAIGRGNAEYVIKMEDAIRAVLQENKW